MKKKPPRIRVSRPETRGKPVDLARCREDANRGLQDIKAWAEAERIKDPAHLATLKKLGTG